MAKPAKKIRWREVVSSNIRMVGWDDANNMYVIFKSTDPEDIRPLQRSTLYYYRGVTRQRAVALVRSASAGKYLNSVIKPNYEAVKVA